MTKALPTRHRHFPSKLAAIAIGFTLLLAVGGWNVIDIHFRHRLGTVTRGQVYKSGAMPPEDLIMVAKDLGLRSVIDLRTFSPGQDKTNTTGLGTIQSEASALTSIGVRHIHLPTPQIPSAETVDRFLKEMSDPANRPVLIHCYHGIGRTELFAALFRIEFEGWSNERARNATRVFIPGSSFSNAAEKGQYLLNYHPRAKGTEQLRSLSILP